MSPLISAVHSLLFIIIVCCSRKRFPCLIVLFPLPISRPSPPPPMSRPCSILLALLLMLHSACSAIYHAAFFFFFAFLWGWYWASQSVYGVNVLSYLGKPTVSCVSPCDRLQSVQILEPLPDLVHSLRWIVSLSAVGLCDLCRFSGRLHIEWSPLVGRGMEAPQFLPEVLPISAARPCLQ